ncbi:hypothetical protein [Streptomyces longispororuber]|uniref:hypothetical protein n=1 Tax=Streptomyces longispororuber TaxID=68230 RepID=UPI00210A62FC|nr:hypothetical protein [Streptomyces longispororuber]MCQ4208328.1 hypothetical protein [Streptomyces longispororuber]
MRPAFLRSAVVTAVLGGALLVPAGAFAEARVPQHATSTATTAPAEMSVPRPPEAQAPDDPSANPYFLLAGGGMAAAGIAGLAYSTVRRGRADG